LLAPIEPERFPIPVGFTSPHCMLVLEHFPGFIHLNQDKHDAVPIDSYWVHRLNRSLGCRLTKNAHQLQAISCRPSCPSPAQSYTSLAALEDAAARHCELVGSGER
jgi:hypothetical protein